MVSAPEPEKQAPHRRKYRRRAIVLLSVLRVEVYLDLLEQGKLQVPTGCPDGCSGSRWGWHDRFERQWVDEGCVTFTLTILRVRCWSCRGVWSLFPAFVWYRFRYSYRLIQSACWGVLSGVSPAALVRRLDERASRVLQERGRIQVPAESTVRSWLTWLGQPWLERLVRWTLSLVARIDAGAARAAVPLLECPRALPGTERTRGRAERVLRVCAVLHAVKRGCTDLLRRSPYQLRDWAAALFWERRQPLARPP